jgi:hypothetical protein
MGDGASAPEDDEAREEEYAELVQLIVHGTWQPGDLVRTTTGRLWQFRATPDTEELPTTTQRVCERARPDRFRYPVF